MDEHKPNDATPPRIDNATVDENSSSSPNRHLIRIAQVSSTCVTDTDVDGVALSLIDDDAGSRDLLYASDSDAARIDELQFTTGEGPCLDAFLTGTPQLHSDLGSTRDTTGWPTFASEVVRELGVHGVFAFPIFSDGARLGVLELYRRRTASLTPNQVAAARTAADVLGGIVVAELISNAELTDEANYRAPRGPFHFARADINVAIGVLAARLHVSTSDASARLRARAFADSRSISSLAHDIVHGGGFDEDPGGAA